MEKALTAIFLQQRHALDTFIRSMVRDDDGAEDSQKEYWEDLRKALRRCMEKLPDKCRQVLALRYDGNRPVAEVADRLGKTTESVTMMLSRIRKSLGDCAERALQGVSV